MDVERQLQTKSLEIVRKALTVKTGDPTKYNLRCNRNISGKMTKKDFIYDIRRPLQGTRKYEEHKQRLPMIVQARTRKSKYPDVKIAKYSITTENEITVVDDNVAKPLHRPVKFVCNYCHESMATMSSLSTHVKSHRLSYCKQCYWIIEEGETMIEHVEKIHHR